MSHDNQHRPALAIACAITCQVVSGIFVAARFYTRRVITKALGWADYCILAAWIFGLGFTILSCISSSSAVGRHYLAVSEEAMKTHLRALYIASILYYVSLAFSKISLLLLYLPILARTYVRYAAWVVLGIVIAYNIFTLVSLSCSCIPVRGFWDVHVEAHCLPQSYVWATIGMHITTDFMIMLLPIPVVYRTTLPRGQKLGVLLLFTLGFFVCIVSIIRAVRLDQLYYNTKDITWDYVEVLNWSAVEFNTSILVPCLLVLKPLLVRLFPGLASRKESSAARYAYGVPRTIGSDPSGPRRLNADEDLDMELSNKPLVSDHESRIPGPGEDGEEYTGPRVTGPREPEYTRQPEHPRQPEYTGVYAV